MENERPPCLTASPDNVNIPDGQYQGIKTGLRDAAVAVWTQTKMDPQLIIVIEPVNILHCSLDRWADD